MFPLVKWIGRLLNRWLKPSSDVRAYYSPRYADTPPTPEDIALLRREIEEHGLKGLNEE
jgi:hypothetical protein